MGVAVFSGMIGVTVFGIFLTPVFYVLLRRWRLKGVVAGPHGGHGATLARAPHDAAEKGAGHV